MQKSIWNKYLELLNKKMKKLDKKILLLVDNATVHAVDNPELLTNITIHYLPPNTTAHLQPADVGIINSFKVCILFLINYKINNIYSKKLIINFRHNIVKDL